MQRLSPARTICLAAGSLTTLLAIAPPDYAVIVPFELPALGPLAELVVHVSIFVPIGATALGWSLGPGISGAWAAALRVAVPLAVVIELYQFWVPAHHAPQVADLLAHVLGSLVGATLAWRYRELAIRARDVYFAHERTIHLSALALACLLIVQLQLLPALWPSSLRTWDSRFPLLVGNELGGERPWLGEIRSLAIHDRALSPREIRDLSEYGGHDAQSPHPAAAEPLLSYTHSAEALEPQSTALPEHAATLVPENSDAIEFTTDRGLRLRFSTVLSTVRPFRELTEALTASGAFTVEVVCRPANLEQQGPARILSLSGGPLERNFTLAQSGGQVVLRVRSPLTGPNGTKRELRGGQLSSARTQHLVATYDRGAARLFIDGEEQPQRVEKPDLRDLGRSAVALVLLAALSFAIAGVGTFGGAGPTTGANRMAVAFCLVSGASWLARAFVTGQSPDFAASLWVAGSVAALSPIVRRLCRA